MKKYSQSKVITGIWPWIVAILFEIVATFFGDVARRHVNDCSGTITSTSLLVRHSLIISRTFGVVGILLAIFGLYKAGYKSIYVRMALLLLIIVFIIWAYVAQFHLSLCGIGS